MSKRFKIVTEGFVPEQTKYAPEMLAEGISIQVVENGYIVSILDVEGINTVKVFNEDDVVEMMQAIMAPLGYHLTGDHV